MKNKSTFFVLGVLFIAVISFLWRVSAFRKQIIKAPEGDTTKVVTSFYPIYYFTREIGKEKVEVTNLTPSGTEPHDYEPGPRNIMKLEESKILIINGAGLEPWSDKIRDNLKNENIKTVTAAEGLATQEVEEGGEKIKDPHVWLDPVLAKQEVTRITSALVEIDSENKSFYELNGRSLKERLDALDQEFKDGLLNCGKKNFVTSHTAFGYTASRYGLKQVAITGLSPDQEPSPRELSEIARFAKEFGVKYIFFETLVSSRLAEAIAKEVGARTLVLDPLEGLTEGEQRKGTDYFSIQKENLKNLRVALECK